MSVRSERWLHGAAPSLGQSSLEAPKLHAWSLMPKLRALRLQRAVSERSGGSVVAAMLATTGAFFIWQASLLDLGNVDLPGPGFFPLCLGAIIVILSAITGIGHWRSSEGEAVELGLAAEREHELLARNAEIAGGPVGRRERDLLERGLEPLG